jgi:transposase-like protein
MHGRETRTLLRHYLEQGARKSALARQLGLSRDTIHRWIRDGELDRDLEARAVRYGPRPAVPTNLDANRPIQVAPLAIRQRQRHGSIVPVSRPSRSPGHLSLSKPSARDRRRAPRVVPE